MKVRVLGHICGFCQIFGLLGGLLRLRIGFNTYS